MRANRHRSLAPGIHRVFRPASRAGREQIDLIRASLQSGQPIELRVSGPCMRPWAFTGDRIVVEPLESRPKKGMILLSRHGDELFAHRVVRTRRNGEILTRGDLSSTNDSWSRRPDILGRVVTVRSQLGFAMRLDRRSLEVVGLVCAPVLRGSMVVAKRLRRF